MTAAIIFLISNFIVYNYLIFAFVDSLLAKPRLKAIYSIPMIILNTVIAIGFTLIGISNSFLVYVTFAIVLFIDFKLFHKEKTLTCWFYSLSCTLHVMTIRSICVAIFAYNTNISVFEVFNDNLALVLTSGITLILLNIAILIVMHTISPKKIRIINEHSEQQLFLVVWLTVFCLYLLVTSYVYSTPNGASLLLINQVIAPITILVGLYIVLFFSFKSSALLGYKEKNEMLEHAVSTARQYRMSMDKGLYRSIEVDFTKDQIITGYEDYRDQVGDLVSSYSKMFSYIVNGYVHPEDKVILQPILSAKYVIELFEQGTQQILFDYRKKMKNNSYEWLQIKFTLLRDAETSHVKGFVGIKNINDEKNQQLEFQYKAERDLFTGLYNKCTAEALIDNCLNSDNAINSTGALFIIDIDNFKTVNDQLGHLYGDAVLSELSECLKNIFRDSDIVGRIGGDEFVVYASGLLDQNTIRKKADEICKSFLRTYSNDKNIGTTVSSSIGIAIFPKDGTDFETLFQYADAALYTAKARGKNRYSFYDQDDTLPYVSSRTEIDTNGLIQKNFRENRVEYVFRLLYGSSDTKSAIISVLELIAKNFGFSRANIFEFNELSTHFNGVIEWCANNIQSVSANYIDMPISNFDFVISALKQHGGMFLATPDDFPEEAREGYTSIDIKSIVHFSIQSRNQLIGVIAFQNCTDDNFTLSATEYEELRTICQVLSVFMATQLSYEREQRYHQAVRAIIDNMNSIAYVIDRETYDIYYENQNVVDITKTVNVGSKCYKVYRGLDKPCDDCALQHLSDENPRCTLELYTEKFDIYTKTSGALIDWTNDRKALLISSVDVTEYKKANK